MSVHAVTEPLAKDVTTKATQLARSGAPVTSLTYLSSRHQPAEHFGEALP